MKTFKEFQEQTVEVSPKGIVGAVTNMLVNKIPNGNKKVKIPTTDEMSAKIGELAGKFQDKVNDPSFQKKYDKGINFLKTFGKQVPTK